MPRLQIILASTRPGRVGQPVAEWLTARARSRPGLEVDLVDLAELALPLLDEPSHPRLRTYTQAHTLAWSERVDRADAFAIVLPEYNHSFPASIKNAIDFLHQEWRGKPVGIASYGGVSGGTRSAVALEPVLLAVGLRPVSAAVAIPFVGEQLDETGGLAASDRRDRAADALLDALTADASLAA